MRCTGCGSQQHFFKVFVSPGKIEYREKFLEKLRSAKGRDRQDCDHTMLINDFQSAVESYGVTSGSSAPPPSRSAHVEFDLHPAVGVPKPVSEKSHAAEADACSERDSASDGEELDNAADDEEIHYLHDAASNEPFYLVETELLATTRDISKSFSVDDSSTLPIPDQPISGRRWH